MLRVAAILAVAGVAVLAAMFSCLLFLGHVISGNVATGLLWLGAAMLAILFAVFFVALNGAPTSSDDDSPDEMVTRSD